jgi:DNA repair protein RadC
MNPKYLKRIVASYVKEKDVTYLESLKDPLEVVKQFKYLETRDREEFVALHVDKANRLICWDRISVGSLNETIVNPREVFKTALLSNAAAMIFIHNHPSGRVDPSPEDHSVTQKLVEVGKLLDIKILDHLIIGEDSKFFSFRESGLL